VTGLNACVIPRPGQRGSHATMRERRQDQPLRWLPANARLSSQRRAPLPMPVQVQM
jgi:hypothetical protein